MSCCWLVCCLLALAVHATKSKNDNRQRYIDITWHAQTMIEAQVGWTKVSDTTPRVYIIDNFISADEIKQLMALADGGWDRQSSTHRTLMLETWPRLAHSSIIRRIDERIRDYTGFQLEAIEDGYIQSYTGGFVPHNAHMDQNPDSMTPERDASVILFLDTQPLGSGHTVFPLARMKHERGQVCDLSQSQGRLPCHPLYILNGTRIDDTSYFNVENPIPDTRRDQLIQMWDRRLRDGLESRDFFSRGQGQEIFELTQEMCRMGFGVRPLAGRALFFLNFEADGWETIRSVHGSCYLPNTSPPKNVLVKPLCGGRVRNIPSIWKEDL